MDAIGTFDDQLEPNTRRRVALHLRVSAKDGRQETCNQNSRLRRLRRLAESQNGEIAHEVSVWFQIAAEVGDAK